MDKLNINSNGQPQIDEEMAERFSKLNEKFKEQEEKGEAVESNYDILKNVEDMIRMNKSKEMKKLKITNETEYHRIFNKKFLNFNMSFPAIYHKIMYDDKFEIDRLKEMLKTRKDVKSNKISTFDASVKISTKYTDEFIKKPLNLK